MPTTKTLEQARKYHIKLTRKLPNSQQRVYKSENQLKDEIKNKKENWSKDGPKCFRPTVAVSEKKMHYGNKCPKNQERTKNFCDKELKKVDDKKIRWYRTITPNKNTRIVIACPK